MKAIVAMTDHGGMGYKGKLPDWNIPGDLERFKRLTEYRTLVMGSNTFFSLPESKRPLPKRNNIVITNKPDHPRFDAYRDRQNVWFTTLADFLRNYKRTLHEIIVIGGAKLINSLYPYIYEMDVTIARESGIPCDVFFENTNDLLQWTVQCFEKDDYCVRMIFTRTVFV